MIDDDAALVARARDGDREAFAALYERYFDRVYDFLVRTVRNRDEAADVAQDTFLRAMNSLGSLREEANFKSWLFTIARNQALNRLERAGRTQPLGEIQGDDDDAPTFDLPDTERLANPADAVEANEMAAIVWEAAAALDARQYSLLDLHVRQGLESAEIAEVLGVTKNNAYVMVNRLKAALEGAVGALVLYRAGRGKCGALDGIIATIETKSLSPDLRKAIEKHAGKCLVCQERRKKEMPLAAFAGLALVQAPIGAKAAGLEAVMGAWPNAGASPGANAAGSNSPSSGGSNAPGGGAGGEPGESNGSQTGTPGGTGSTVAEVHVASKLPAIGTPSGPILMSTMGHGSNSRTGAITANSHDGGPSTRSKRSRRRTAALIGTGGTVLLALLLSSFVAFSGNDDADRVLDATKLDNGGGSDGGTFTQAAGVTGGGTPGSPGSSASAGEPSATVRAAGGPPPSPTSVIIANPATGTAVARSANVTATSAASATTASGVTSGTPTPSGTQANTAGTPTGQFVPGGSSATPTATRTSTPTRTPTTGSGAPIFVPTATNTPVPPRIDTPTAIPPIVATPTVPAPIIDTPTPVTPAVITPTPVTPVIDTPTPVTPTAVPPPPPPACQPSLAIAPNAITIIGPNGSGAFTVTNTSVNCTASLPISASPGVSWLGVTPGSAVLPPGGSITFVATASSTAPGNAVETRVVITGGLLSYQVDVKYLPGLVIAPTRTPTPNCSTPNC